MPNRIVCFGELLLRLGAPGRQRLLQSARLDVHVGGAEANVAVALARFGHEAAMVGRVPANALGEAALGELRRWGVDTRGVGQGPGRMGLYFLQTGALHRPSEVLYDRAHSAFALAKPESFDWNVLLAGADAFHLSGVTPALGPESARAAAEAMAAARTRGLKVSFDGNFRPRLWEAWAGDAPGILRGLMAEADLLFADHRDIAVVLGRRFEQADPVARFRAAAEAAFDAFPGLARMCATHRQQHSVDHHALGAWMATREGGFHAAAPHELVPIVDRIGTGDAFAAGVLHGRLLGWDDPASLGFGLGAACLKHAQPGDFGLADAAEVAAFVEGRFDVRR